jgi:hypothetical protein
MARFSYALTPKQMNGTTVPRQRTLAEVLDRSSSRAPAMLPVACNWLVDWSYFFKKRDDPPPPGFNFSRPIQPYAGTSPLAEDTYFPNEDDAHGGIFYRDLIRGADAGVRTVGSIIARIREADRKRSQLLDDASYRREKIRAWLQASDQHTFGNEELDSLSQDPPLFFFVLFEAAHTQDGERLGVLGSIIVAEIFFAAYKNTTEAIEDDRAGTTKSAFVFGDDIPSDMPDLIKFVRCNGGLAEVSCS